MNVNAGNERTNFMQTETTSDKRKMYGRQILMLRYSLPLPFTVSGSYYKFTPYSSWARLCVAFAMNHNICVNFSLPNRTEPNTSFEFDFITYTRIEWHGMMKPKRKNRNGLATQWNYVFHRTRTL